MINEHGIRFFINFIITKIHHFKIRDNCERNVNIFLRAKETLRKRIKKEFNFEMKNILLRWK